MDKNTIIGFLLIIAVVIGFTWYTTPSKEEVAAQQRHQDSIAQVQAQQIKTDLAEVDSLTKKTANSENKVDEFFAVQSTSVTATDSLGNLSNDSTRKTAPINEEKIVSLENEKIKVDLSTKGGQIVKVHLKGFSNYNKDSLSLFGDHSQMTLMLTNNKSLPLSTENALFIPIVGKDNKTLTMRLAYSDEKHIDFIYAIAPDSYIIKFDIVAVGMKDLLSRESQNSFVVKWNYAQKRNEKSIKNENRYSGIHYKYNGQSVEELGNSKDKKEEINNPVRWVAFKDQFFATTIIGDEPFESSLLSSKLLDTEKQQEYLKDYEATLYSPVSVENNGVLRVGYKIFTGPLEYYLLKGYDDGVKENEKQLDLDQLIPLGWTLFRWVNQYFVIPLFSWLSSLGLPIGLVILLLTVIVKLIISPLTFKSFMSSAKMRVLRPQIEEINKKFPKQEQAMDRQQATMALYSKAGVSPMAGCIPMLLQMPILLALFAFFPSAIELRHQSFLWASDLSTYDAILEWNANIPLISWALGNHLSLFCILMTVTSIVYTKFNMDATNTGQQQMPGMKWMMYLMPVFFLFVLNDYPSGLTYYYFLSTLITILLTLIFRWTINEDKVLAKLEANKLKPKKKSGFMAKLEEAQRLQQQQAREQSKKNNRGGNSKGKR